MTVFNFIYLAKICIDVPGAMLRLPYLFLGDCDRLLRIDNPRMSFWSFSNVIESESLPETLESGDELEKRRVGQGWQHVQGFVQAIDEFLRIAAGNLHCYTVCTCLI